MLTSGWNGSSAKVAYKHNIFGVIRQVMYSKLNTNEIDFVVFINIVAGMLEEKTEFVQTYFVLF